jgi:hypothetical protein
MRKFLSETLIISETKTEGTFVDIHWSRSQTIGLAKENCAQCHGLGLRDGIGSSSEAPCNCVLRNIFRVCYARFRYCVEREKHVSQARLAIIGGKDRRQVWGRKDEEYIADFCLVSKRFLDESEYRIFRFHFLLGADWRLCCRRLKMDRGTFFHETYRIQQKLGRIFRELEPYSLYPLDEYFGGTYKRALSPEAARELKTPFVMSRRPLRPPLKKIA